MALACPTARSRQVPPLYYSRRRRPGAAALGSGSLPRLPSRAGGPLRCTWPYSAQSRRRLSSNIFFGWQLAQTHPPRLAWAPESRVQSTRTSTRRPLVGLGCLQGGRFDYHASTRFSTSPGPTAPPSVRPPFAKQPLITCFISSSHSGIDNLRVHVYQVIYRLYSPQVSQQLQQLGKSVYVRNVQSGIHSQPAPSWPPLLCDSRPAISPSLSMSLYLADSRTVSAKGSCSDAAKMARVPEKDGHTSGL